MPAFHSRDLALGDIDRDGDLDMVLTWDDPTTVSAYGFYAGSDVSRVATRVLQNDGNAKFTDVTASWLPAASAPEFWQAGRVVLADLDGDVDLDLLLLHARTLGATPASRPALRILRNDGATAGFVDVTTTAVPAATTALPDDWRGEALTVADVDGDGHPDVLVSTTETLRDGDGARLRSTRLLLGDGALRFRRGDGFLPPVAVDSGEAGELLLGDLEGADGLSLLRLSESSPATSPGGAALRAADRTR